jgi:hypothetical protein
MRFLQLPTYYLQKCRKDEPHQWFEWYRGMKTGFIQGKQSVKPLRSLA